MEVQRLPGGFVNDVIRVGSTVRRTTPPNASFVRRLLEHFAQQEWPGAPRFLGTDDEGREMLTFLEGHVAWEPSQPPDVASDESLVAVANLIRQFHDLTAGSELGGDHEVVCHNDLSPKNTVYRDGGAGLRPVAFIDWDIAAPGERGHDVAHACWQYVGLGPDVADPLEAARRVRVIVDGYGLVDRAAVVDTILWWQDRCWRGIEAAAEAGEPAMIRLRDSGAADRVKAAHLWTSKARATFEQALR